MWPHPWPGGSGVVSSFMKADGILEIPQGSEGLEAGSEVPVRLLRPACDLEHTLVAIGSHDPLLDELADLIHQADPSSFMSSSHVGSMGGLMAIRRRETHMAGCHLLNEADGSYNTAILEKQFPNGGVYQVECVGRTQGLMVASGNPLGLTGFRDIARSGIRYVNRQKGSGTRILADYLCRKEGVDPATVYGYEREEFTHTAVAAQIAGGTCRCRHGDLVCGKNLWIRFLACLRRAVRSNHPRLCLGHLYDPPGIGDPGGAGVPGSAGKVGGVHAGSAGTGAPCLLKSALMQWCWEAAFWAALLPAI